MLVAVFGIRSAYLKLNANEMIGLPEILAIGVPLAVLLLLPAVRKQRYSQSIAQNPDLYEMEMGFNEEGIRILTRNVDSKVKWAGISLVENTREAIYLYLIDSQAYVIPKRCIDDEQERRILELSGAEEAS